MTPFLQAQKYKFYRDCLDWYDQRSWTSLVPSGEKTSLALSCKSRERSRSMSRNVDAEVRRSEQWTTILVSVTAASSMWLQHMESLDAWVVGFNMPLASSANLSNFLHGRWKLPSSRSSRLLVWLAQACLSYSHMY